MPRLSLFFLLPLLSACTLLSAPKGSGLPAPSPNVAEVLLNPQLHTGETVTIEAFIIGMKNAPEGGIINLVPLDQADGATAPPARQTQCIVATTPEQFDEGRYRNGRVVTLSGEVKGRKSVMTDDGENMCTVIAIREAAVWENSDEEGYSGVPPHYDPYYHGYPEYPHRFRPEGPKIHNW